jgi:CRISPR-associated protein Cmr5
MKRENSTKLIAKNCVVEKVLKEENDKNILKSYRSLIIGLGAMIIQNGLYGTLVFLRAKGKRHHEFVFEDIRIFLEKKKYIKSKDVLEFLEQTDNLSSIQERVLEFVNWYRRYAEIFIKTSNEDDENN